MPRRLTHDEKDDDRNHRHDGEQSHHVHALAFAIYSMASDISMAVPSGLKGLPLA